MNKINFYNYKKKLIYFGKIIFFLFRFLINTILIYIILLQMLNLFFKEKKDIINITQFNYFQVASGSMETTINTGDLVIIKKISDEEYSKLKAGEDGDIVVFENKDITSEAPIIHRVFQNDIEKQKIKTKGDNNEVKDGPETPYKNIIGKYVLKINKTHQMIILFIFILLFIYYFFSIFI
ncbi:signal peptidase I ['Camptotheca acuminata' phytoplasma]|uniref:signal peptidase I n=1 Tax='Camptotheca acuminata' phytoplasma TaxID=3239192 RepID=UPI00351A4513